MKLQQLPNNKDSLLTRYQEDIDGVISCFDRIVLFGTFRSIGHPEAMSWQLHESKVKLLEYEKNFANSLRLEVRDQIKHLCKEEHISTQFINYGQRKEDVVSEIISNRGNHDGIVCVLECMESCRCFKVTKNKMTGYLQLSWSKGKCLHYYVYLIDDQLGLCYLRIPTWAPFRLQFYFNGHDWLERQMHKAGIKFEKQDNCYCNISDYSAAQAIVESFNPDSLHQRLNAHAQHFVSVYSKFGESLNWSVWQAEWATDIVFSNSKLCESLYHEIQRTAVFEVHCHDIYRFMGKRLTKQSEQEVSSRLKTTIEGTRVKHTLGPTSIKMYDKQNCVIRIETTTNNVSVFKHYREVRHRDGTTEKKYAAMLKTIYSLGALAEQMQVCNCRYIDFISRWRDHTKERTNLNHISHSVRDDKQRSYRGINLFQSVDSMFVQAILDGAFTLHGFTNKLLQKLLPGWSSNKICRMLKRFRIFKLIKRVKKSHRYYLSTLGKGVLVAALQLRERIVMPALQT